MKDTCSKVLEVPHPESLPQNRTEAVIESFRSTVARSVDEVVGDLVEPVLDGFAESIKGFEAQLASFFDPNA